MRGRSAPLSSWRTRNHLPDDPTTLDDGDPDALVDTREAGANQLGLETKLAAMDRGEAAAVFATGMAAIQAASPSPSAPPHTDRASDSSTP